MTLSRRTVLAAGAASSLVAATAGAGAQRRPSNAARFALGYAPHEGSFASRGGLIEQIAYAADQGFTAWEDNEARGRPVAQQEAMAKALASRGMTMGVFVASMPKWAQSRPLLGGNDEAEREGFLADIRSSIEVAKRLNANRMTVVTGFLDNKLPLDIQTARVIDVMRKAGDIVAPHGLAMVMEPLNTRTNHPGVYLQTIAQGYAVARGANSPGVKILADLYHEQIQSGNLIPTLAACWSEIGYIQFGDNPGRNEPGTGEINYANIVRWLKDKRYAGVIGMEHGNATKGRAGEERLIAAYRAIDGGERA
ncbi:hydroxypyruvate isomerase family protein [Sphingomonas carotinifaciens]|uniref:Hydroxypyruvate isomerase n=1 Tax=Sphingomonas carotinifaciens TaxID=1166323 RepID=A0A1G7P921_9SPHN|nr:TIM barrel protein [Sphingomonas carotinifaciens]MBB4087333.1 hydroxypyruvate isomerase [Sphingomonas carotinifaciens]MWC44642.1 TIM barrel protein [Sphingomonas carotinifaciens]SDF82099.1 hydroxypyruvate isomerase [Sphingomonas carotinifaciens]